MPIAPLSPDRRALAAKYWPLAKTLAKAMGRGHPKDCWDELYSAAGWGLIEAAGRFAEGGPASFNTYARRVIVGRIADARRAYYARRSGKDLRRHGSVLRAEFGCLSPLMADARQPDPAELVADRADEWLATLPRHEAAAIRLVDVEGRSLDATGRLLARSHGKVFVDRRRGLARLRERIAGVG